MIIARAPVRISFLGGGTDYLPHFKKNGGAVLGTAVDKYAYITAAPYLQTFHGHHYKLSYSKIETADNIDEIKHPLLREAIRMACPDMELELHYIADLPAKTGLGSSSSFLVATLQSLHGLSSNDTSAQQLAEEAIHIERHILKEPGGYQDQVMAAFGGFNLVEFSGEGKFTVNNLSLPPERQQSINEHCLILYTGVNRNSFEVSKTQMEKTNDGSNADTLNKLADLARQGAEFLVSDKPLIEFGELLNEGWNLKQKLGDINFPEADRAYEEALKLGATGGKLLGAGKGGFVLLWAPPETHQEIIGGISNRMPALQIKAGAAGSTIIHDM